MTINSFRDLRIWQDGMNLVEQIYYSTQAFPTHERYGLTHQVRRAAVSIPSNIAEGHTRESRKEYLYHLSIAQASLAELQTQIEIAGRLQYLAKDQRDPILRQAISLSRQIYALRNALKRKD